MGTFTVPVDIFSLDGRRSVTVEATVDTGSSYTCLPSLVLSDLGIAPVGKMRFELADGSVIEDDIGEARVRVADIERTTIVVFASDSSPALLGAYTLEGAGLAVDPVRLSLVPTTAIRYALSPVAIT